MLLDIAAMPVRKIKKSIQSGQQLYYNLTYIGGSGSNLQIGDPVVNDVLGILDT